MQETLNIKHQHNSTNINVNNVVTYNDNTSILICCNDDIENAKRYKTQNLCTELTSAADGQTDVLTDGHARVRSQPNKQKRYATLNKKIQIKIVTLSQNKDMTQLYNIIGRLIKKKSSRQIHNDYSNAVALKFRPTMIFPDEKTHRAGRE